MNSAKFIHLEEINSTNDYAKKHISELEDLTVIYADRQISGRGRLDRKWIDTGEDNLFLTIIVKPSEDLTTVYQNFTQYLCVILCMLLEEEYYLSPKIKWPNDVLINGKKIAGILSEGTTKGDKFLGLALGIGVNLNTSKDNLAKIDKPATSLLVETGEKIDKKLFLEKLYSKFCLLYDRFVCEGFPYIKNEYLSRFVFLGKNLTINVLGELHNGVAEGITEDGSLILNENNNMKTYYIGDIL